MIQLRWLIGYRLHFALMILTLPWMSGLVIDVGGNLRICYIFAGLTLLTAWRQGLLLPPPVNAATVLLGGFVAYSAISTLFTLWIPSTTFDSIVANGFRITPFRSLVQFGQLGLMVTVLYLVINHVKTRAALNEIINLAFIATAFVVLYGLYQFITGISDLPYLNLNTNPDTNPNRYFADTMGRWGAGVMLPRPRSVLFEPQELATFLMFGLPFACLAVSLAQNKLLKAAMVAIVLVGFVVFMMANSLGAFLALPAAGLAAIILTRRYKAALLGLAATYGVLAFIVFPLVGSHADPRTPALFYVDQVVRIVHPSQWGDRHLKETADIIKSNLVAGVGIGNYPFLLPLENAETAATEFKTTSPFSLPLRQLAETGLIGTGLFALFIGAIALKLLRTRGDVADASLISIVGVMVASLTLDHLYVAAWLWAVLAMGVVAAYPVRRTPGAMYMQSVSVPLGDERMASVWV